RCLRWWRQRCLEWCYDRLEDGKFADQKYLDDWPSRFPGVVVLRHKGANLAPWNVARYKIRRHKGTVLIDSDPLICYHFHSLKIVTPHLFDLSLGIYEARLGRVLQDDIYLPYLRHLQSLFPKGGSAWGGNLRNPRVYGQLEKLLRLMVLGTPLFVC